MQLIKISDTMTASELFNICKENAISFPGFRAKIAKARYIAAIEAFNATIETAVESDFSQGLIEASEISNDRFIAPVIRAALIAVTMTVAGVKWAWVNRVHEYILGAFLVAVSLTFAAVYHTVQYCQAIAYDDHPGLAVATDTLRIVPLVARVAVTVAKVIGVIVLTVVIGGMGVAVTRLRAFDWFGLAVALSSWVIRSERSLIVGGEAWADSTGANG